MPDDLGADPPEVSAFVWVPPFARGQVRDLRVRWALELLGRYPTLADCVARGEARPAFQRALAAQLADFVPDPI